MELAGFTSALPYAKVRDFAYHDRHPLHYGVRDTSKSTTPQNDASGNTQSPVTGSFLDGAQVSGIYEQGQSQPDGVPARPKSKDDIYRRAVSLFDFEPENENEARLKEGQILWISYRHGQGWLVAENLETGETGLVPEEYVQVLPENDGEWVDA